MDIISAAALAVALFIGGQPVNHGSQESVCDARNRPIEISTSTGQKTYLRTNHAGKACGNVFDGHGTSAGYSGGCGEGRK